MQEDPQEAEDAEFSDANEIILPEEKISPLTVAEASHLPPEVLVSPEVSGESNPVWNKQYGTPQDPPSPLIFASRPITRLKYHRVPKGEVHHVTHEEIHYSPKEFEFSNSQKQRPNGKALEWILRVWDSGGKSIQSDQAEFVDTGPVSKDAKFNAAAH